MHPANSMDLPITIQVRINDGFLWDRRLETIFQFYSLHCTLKTLFITFNCEKTRQLIVYKH